MFILGFKVKESAKAETGREIMNTITTEQMIAAGGNLWEKGSAKRIYLNDAALVALFDISESDALALKQAKPAKKSTYFCMNSESFYSANGMIIRNAIRASAENATVNKI